MSTPTLYDKFMTVALGTSVATLAAVVTGDYFGLASPEKGLIASTMLSVAPAIGTYLVNKLTGTAPEAVRADTVPSPALALA